MAKCYVCGEKLVKDTKIISYKGKNVIEKIERCSKCGETFTSPKEANRVASELHPGIGKIFRDFFLELENNLKFFFRKVL